MNDTEIFEASKGRPVNGLKNAGYKWAKTNENPAMMTTLMTVHSGQKFNYFWS